MPASKQAYAIFGQRIRGQGYDRRASAALPGLAAADPLGRLDAVESRHLHVHQHQIVRRAGAIRAASQDSSAASPLVAMTA